MNIQCDQITEARRSDIVFFNNEKEAKIIDAAVPGNMRVKDKLEKIEKHQLLKDEIRRLRNMK